MFKDQVTGYFSRRGAKCHKIVTQIAMRSYHRMIRDEETRRMVKVEVGQGFEIIKELNATEEGVRIWNENHPNGPEVVERPKTKKTSL